VKTRLRELHPSDVPVVNRLLQEQNERDSTSYSLPLLFDAYGRRLQGIPLALIAEDVETHEVHQAHVWEQTVEQTSYGINPRATVCSMKEFDAIAYVLRQRGFRDMHTLVPTERVGQMQHGLDRLCRMSATGLTHFYRLLDPAENAALRTFYQDQKEAA
jgi:hypothetical protein